MSSDQLSYLVYGFIWWLPVMVMVAMICATVLACVVILSRKS